jgi:hypothetical protein
MNGPINPGVVDWSGENPGIYLKDSQDGPWLSLAVFFRVVTSDHGRGLGIVVLGAPGVAQGFPAVENLCITDNPPLMRDLVARFLVNFASFRNQAGVGAMTWLPLLSQSTAGDARRFYSESMRAPGVDVSLVWENLQAPMAADVPAEMGPTKAHQMYSVFQEAKHASIIVNGKPLAGRVFPRDFLGRKMSTAFLAFSETWVKPPA